MTTTVTPTAVQAAEILDKAAEHLDRVGLYKGYLYDEAEADKGTALTDCPACAAGAILAAAYGQPRYPSEDPDSNVTDVALHELEATIGRPIARWNDERSRQKRQVVKALRDTAARLRAEAGK